MSQKREDYISWDEYFMGVAMLSGMRSKDPNTQVGACIVSPDNNVSMIIQLLIQCSDIDIHIRMCFLHSFYTFGCSDDAQQTDALAALVL